MSTTSNIHTAIVYEAKGANKTVALTGQRLIVTIAKADKAGNYGPHLQQTMATSVPQLSADSIVDALNDDTLQVRLIPHLVEFLEGVQNQLVASRIKGGTRSVTTEELEIPALCSYLESESTSEKWTTERIAAWFNDSLAESIGVALIEKGWSDEKMESSLAAYSKLISESFSSKAAIPRVKAVAIQKALALGDSSDVMIAKFQARITKILEVQNLDEALGL